MVPPALFVSHSTLDQSMGITFKRQKSSISWASDLIFLLIFTSNRRVMFLPSKLFLISFLFLPHCNCSSLFSFPCSPPCSPFFHIFMFFFPLPLIAAFSQLCLCKTWFNAMSWVLILKAVRFGVTLILSNNEFQALVPRKFLVGSFFLGDPKRMSYLGYLS